MGRDHLSSSLRSGHSRDWAQPDDRTISYSGRSSWHPSARRTTAWCRSTRARRPLAIDSNRCRAVLLVAKGNGCNGSEPSARRQEELTYVDFASACQRRNVRAWSGPGHQLREPLNGCFRWHSTVAARSRLSQFSLKRSTGTSHAVNFSLERVPDSVFGRMLHDRTDCESTDGLAAP